jgi:hypothetical protein
MNEGHALASTLEPVLRDACRGKLSPVRWFEATWQHGGAGTGYAEWRTPRGRDIACVVKLPVGYPEYAWTKRLGLTAEEDWDSPEAASLPTPRVLAGGFELGAYDFAWLVMERFPGMPLGAHKMDAGDVWSLFETTAEFHAAAVLQEPVDQRRPARTHDWPALLDRACREIEGGFLPSGLDGWLPALGRVREALPGLADRWAARPMDTWCHRDVHAHNAMRRAPADAGTGRGALALIDLARVAPGCWIEDALYFERLCWGREEILCSVDPLTTLARARLALGLPAPDEDLALADVRRVLMAATSPAFSRTQADPIYLKSALERLERLLPTVCG